MDDQGFRTLICKTVEEVEKAVDEFEKKTVTKFVKYRKDSSYGKNLSADKVDQKRLYFEHINNLSVDIPFTGTPFIFVGTYVMCCHQGDARNTSKQKERMKEILEGTNCSIKRRRVLKDSKKVGCKAKIYITQVLQFPENKLTEDTPFLRRILRQTMKPKLSLLVKENLFYVKLPATTEHSGHPVGQQACQSNSVQVKKSRTGRGKGRSRSKNSKATAQSPYSNSPPQHRLGRVERPGEDRLASAKAIINNLTEQEAKTLLLQLVEQTPGMMISVVEGDAPNLPRPGQQQ